MSGWIEIDLDRPTRFNTIAVIEPVHLASYETESRIVSYRVEAQSDGNWRDILGDEVTTPHIHRVKEATAAHIRLTVTGKDKSPGVAEFGIYAEPS